MDRLITDLKERHRIVLVPRGGKRASHHRQLRFAGIVIPETRITLADLAARCALFTGAGGTMTREAAVIGIPTISVYRSELLKVNRFLLAKGHMRHQPDLSADAVLEYLRNVRRQGPSAGLLTKGAEARDMIINELLNLASGR